MGEPMRQPSPEGLASGIEQFSPVNLGIRFGFTALRDGAPLDTALAASRHIANNTLPSTLYDSVRNRSLHRPPDPALTTPTITDKENNYGTSN